MAREEYEMKVGFAADQKTVKIKIPDGDLKPWDLDTKFETVGTDVDRIDGIAKATGTAKYTFDVNLPGMLQGVMLRSNIPSGRVKKIDFEAASKMPGVRAIVPLKDPAEGRRNRVRWVGDPIAAVAADRREQALDAIEKIVVEYETSQAVIDMQDGEDAPKLEGGEITSPWPDKGNERMEEALGECKHTRSGTWFAEVQTHSALESHGHVCSWDDDKGTLEVWASTQATFGARFGLARALNIGGDKVTIHAEYVGGGFGAKFSPGTEGVACALLTREAKAPVKLMLDRFEEHTCAGNRPSALMQIRAGIDADNTITAWDYRCYGGPGYRGRGGRTTFPRSYLEDAHVRATQKDIATNTDAGRAMRAPGWPQGYFAGEGMIDALAEAAGIDPLEFRLHNESEKLREAEWRMGAEKFDWAKRWQPYGERDYGKRYLKGAGMASAMWGQMGHRGRGSPNAVKVRIHADGTVESRNGAQDIGTGMKTVLAMLTAEELQIPVGTIKVTMGDTNDPAGPASGGSTTTPSLAPAARLAAGMAKNELRTLVAEHLRVEEDKVTVENGRWGVPGGKTLLFEEACKLIGPQPIEKVGERTSNYKGYKNNVCGCQFAEVEVDTRTGFVRVTEMLGIQDCGTVIAKKLAESQVLGAMIGALSYTLHEQRIMDPKSGRMLNGDLMMYKIAGAADMPKLTAHMFPVANGKNSVGAAGLGEPPSVAGPAAIANAVANAIGAPVRNIPITPDQVLAAIDSKKGGK